MKFLLYPKMENILFNSFDTLRKTTVDDKIYDYNKAYERAMREI